MFFYDSPMSNRAHRSRVRLGKSRGFTLIEIVLATSIFTMFFLSISFFYKKALDVSKDTTGHIQSGYFLEEGIEAVKLMRDAGWTTNIATLTPGTTYYLYWNGSMWTATTTVQVLENTYTRSFVIANVARDANDNIVSSGGTNDPGTKMVTLNISWMRYGNKGITSDSIQTYITNLLNN